MIAAMYQDGEWVILDNLTNQKNRITSLSLSCPGLARRSGDQTSRFELLDKAKAKAPSRSLIRIDDVGITTAFLGHDAARLVTGKTLYIDDGYHIINWLASARSGNRTGRHGASRSRLA